MNSLDLMLAIPLALGFYKGYSKGIISTILSVMIWIFGWMIAARLSDYVVDMLGSGIKDSPLAPVVAFALVMIAIAFLINYLSKFFDKMLKAVMLGWANRLCGALVYALGAGLLLSGILWLTDSLHLGEEKKQESTLYPFLQPIAPAFSENVGYILPIFKNTYSDISESINKHIPKKTDL